MSGYVKRRTPTPVRKITRIRGISTVEKLPQDPPYSYVFGIDYADEVREIGIFTPHESLPAERDFDRQFLRIVSSGVHGREEYFTRNPKLPLA